MYSQAAMPATPDTVTCWLKSDLWAWRQSGPYSSTLRFSTRDAWRFKNFTAFYIVSLLTISASLFSIKTAALLWFLYGTLNNLDRVAWEDASELTRNAGSEG